MKISDLGRATGTKPVTIRFYEKIGLLPPPARTGGNYRHYTDEHRLRLTFVRRLRDLGFELPEIRSLIELADRPSSPAGRDALPGHWRNVDMKIGQLAALRAELERMLGEGSEGPHTSRLLQTWPDPAPDPADVPD